MIKKWSFPDKALWNHFTYCTVCDAAAVRSSTASSFNKCFFVNSITLCLVYKTKCSDQSSDTIRDAIKNKLSIYPGILLISVQRCEQAFKTKRVNANILSLHLSYWLKCVDCVRKWMHLYTVSNVDTIATVIVISICFWRDKTLTFSVIKCQAISG